MRTRILAAVLAAGLGGASAPSVAAPASAQEGQVIELTAPRALRSDEGTEVQLTAGRLPRGARLQLTNDKGEFYGALAPFGPMRDRAGTTTATIPIPRSALVDGRVRVRVRVLEPGAAPRAPHPDEVRNVSLVVAPQSR